MPTFPRGLTHTDGRSLSPMSVEWPTTPGPLFDPGATGKDQVRGSTQRGFSWTETYDLLAPSDPVARGFLADLSYWATAGIVLDVEHPDVHLLGAGGGTPVVAGADQTGNTIALSGFPGSTLVLRKGDFIRFAATTGAHEVREDATTAGGGTVTVSVNPPIYAAPANGEAVILPEPGVGFFKARIASFVRPKGESSRANFLSGVSVTFREAL